jgi:hypothetical protein
MSQKSFVLVILSSLKSMTVSSKLLHYVVTLLSIPFVTPNIQQTEKDLITHVCCYNYKIILFLKLYVSMIYIFKEITFFLYIF